MPIKRNRSGSNRRATDLLAYIYEGEQTDIKSLQARAGECGWTVNAVKAAVTRLVHLGALYVCGYDTCEKSGQKIRILTRDESRARDIETQGSDRWADSGANLPIVKLMFPRPQAITAHRQIRKLTGAQEDAA